MPNKVQLTYPPEFKRNLRHLSKKYRTIKSDLAPLLHQLKNGETPGEQIQGVGATLYKVRVRNSDSNKGKRGGYKVIYYIKRKDLITLLVAYSKNEQSDISSASLHTLIDKYKIE